jgi:hypothetical protein
VTTAKIWHLVRLRQSEDLPFLRPGLLDELVINANQLENSPESTAAHLRQTGLPYMVDPVLWRFQEPEWWRNEGGETKRNYVRLAQAYARDTSIRMAEGPLLSVVPSDAEWEQLAGNVVAYELERLSLPTQLDLLDETAARILAPVRVIAPALVARSQTEDRINRLLVKASSAAAGSEVVAVVAVPLERLRRKSEIPDLVKTVPKEGVAAYVLWTPDVTEDHLIGDHELFSGVLSIVSALRGRGLPICHSQGSYVTAALHSAGVDGVMHHLGWVDKGEPAKETRGGLRSCQSYVPGVRHSVRFHNALDLGRELSEADYRARYCDCAFCVGSFEAGQHPLDLLLEEHRVPYGKKGTRLTPTARATSANMWHYLLSRRQEVESFSRDSALTVIQRDMERALQLASPRDRVRLQRLAAELQTA